ncbi:MAG: aminotransferase class III-fold pyridoxal phosphate-dependent enzyme [Ilumatobacteraceae bacterium]
MPIAGGEGSWIWDFDDNRYLDFSSQLMNVNLGHRHPTLVAAIQEAAGRLATIAPFHANADRSEAARLIAEVAPEGMSKVFFTNGGADANENAIRMARLHTGRHKILSAHRSYHGATAGSITLTGDPAPLAVRTVDARRRPLLRPLPLPVVVPLRRPGPEMRTGAGPSRRGLDVRGRPQRGGDHPRAGGGHQRDPRAARRVPGRRAGAVRPPRHHVDRR